MRIGLHIGPTPEFTPVDRFLDFVRRAEGLGFDPLLFSDTVSLSHLRVRDPYVLMALASQVTERARLGICVTTPITRHLTVTANAIASVDDASGGRAVLGVGTGDTSVYMIGKKAQPLGAMRDSLAALRALLDGAPARVEGRELRSNWRKPRLPLFLAAGGPRTLALGGELADGVITLAGVTPEAVRWVRDRVAEGEAKAGRAGGSLPLWVDGLVGIGEDRRSIRESLKPRVCNIANQNFRLAYHGVPEAHLEEVRRFRTLYDEADVGQGTKNAARVTDYLLDRFAIAGGEAEVAGRFEALAAEGVDAFLVLLPFREEERTPLIEKLARTILPRVDAQHPSFSSSPSRADSNVRTE
jgi:5,10-methylenetetrahydromethanopterin reductase